MTNQEIKSMTTKAFRQLMFLINHDQKRKCTRTIFNLCAVRLNNTNIEFEELEHPATQLKIETDTKAQ